MMLKLDKSALLNKKPKQSKAFSYVYNLSVLNIA